MNEIEIVHSSSNSSHSSSNSSHSSSTIHQCKARTMHKSIGQLLDDVIEPIIKNLGGDDPCEEEENKNESKIQKQTFGIPGIAHLFVNRFDNSEAIQNIIDGRKQEIRIQQKLMTDMIGLKVIIESPLVEDIMNDGILLCDPYVHDNILLCNVISYCVM
eukprot:666255_1